MTFTKGDTYAISLRRPRGPIVTYDHARYMGRDPERDGVLVFWWMAQSVLLKVEEAVVTEATETSGVPTTYT